MISIVISIEMSLLEGRPDMISTETRWSISEMLSQVLLAERSPRLGRIVRVTAEIRAERRPRAVLRVAPVAAEVAAEVGGGRGDHYLPGGLAEQPGAVRRRALAAYSQRSLLAS